MKKGKIEKALKPSQRKSITEYSSRFAHSPDVDLRAKHRRLARILIIALIIALLIYTGYFISDLLIRITEITPETSAIISEANTLWNLSLLIQG